MIERRLNVAALTAFPLLLAGCSALCNNKVGGQMPSPDRTRRAVFFSRSCGLSWNLSILGANDELPNDRGNVIAADVDYPATKIHVRWQSANDLVVSYPAGARISYKSDSVDGVNISFTALPASEP